MSTTTVPSSTEAMPVVLLEWKPIAKGSLRGFATVRLGRSLVIRDLAILHGNGRAWVGLPGKPIISASAALGWRCISTERQMPTFVISCAAWFAELLPYSICRTITSGFSVRCSDCSRVDAAPVLLAASHAPAASQDDRDCLPRTRTADGAWAIRRWAKNLGDQ